MTAKSKNTEIDKFIRIALLGAMIAWTFQLLYPLLGILSWSFILAIILYPLYDRLNTLIGNRPTIAATTIIACVLLLVIGASIFITDDLTRTISNVTTGIRLDRASLSTPAILEQWPSLAKAWSSLVENFETISHQYANVLTGASKYVLEKLLNMGMVLLLFFISILLSGFLMVHAVSLMNLTKKLAKRIAGERGSDFINLIKNTIQNISRGVLGISLLQSFIFGVLLLIAKVPAIGLLCILALILGIIQAGLLILAAPVIIWLFFTYDFSFALLITILLILDTLLDSFLKPFVLGRGLPTPLIIIFIGLLGGILTYGFIGIFIGPVVLALAYDLLYRWLE